MIPHSLSYYDLNTKLGGIVLFTIQFDNKLNLVIVYPMSNRIGILKGWIKLADQTNQTNNLKLNYSVEIEF